MRRTYALLAALGIALAVAGCGAGGHSGRHGKDFADHNAADVTFAQHMVPHHAQAVEMARLAPARAARPEVRQLAARIEAAQDPEIRLMTSWLDRWGERVDHGGRGHARCPG
jgi:uncharacterized protein (DUF305 family)